MTYQQESRCKDVLEMLIFRFIGWNKNAKKVLFLSVFSESFSALVFIYFQFI